MDASDLRYFEAVARLGGMNRAAAALNTVQSNVTARVRDLEDELGVKLFRRHSRGTELTRAGERLLPYATKVARMLAEARRAALDDGVPKGPLRLARWRPRRRTASTAAPTRPASPGRARHPAPRIHSRAAPRTRTPPWRPAHRRPTRDGTSGLSGTPGPAAPWSQDHARGPEGLVRGTEVARMRPEPRCVIDRSRPCGGCVAPSPRECPYAYLLDPDEMSEVVRAGREAATRTASDAAGPYAAVPAGEAG